MSLPPDLLHHYLSAAQSLTPTLNSSTIPTSGPITLRQDPAAFQGWTTTRPTPFTPLPLPQGTSHTFAFPRHVTGYLRLRLRVDTVLDAPIRIAITAAEVPAELGEDPNTHWSHPHAPQPNDQLSRSWFQDDTYTLDVIPEDGWVELPRRYALRYLRLTVLAHSKSYTITLTALEVRAVTSADLTALPPAPTTDPQLLAIDRAACLTLAECMHTVFEDGPKRDRRLWLGDLRLQALTSYSTHRNDALVKRCLYLFAAFLCPDGIAPADLYERPHPHRGHCRIFDYAALFPVTLYEYLQHTNDLATAKDLLPAAHAQLSLLRYVHDDGLFHDPGDFWLFIDWCPQLDRQASEHAHLCLVLQSLLHLHEALGLPPTVDDLDLKQTHTRLLTAARTHLLDPNTRLILSGPTRQLSLASQAHSALAGILTKEEAAHALTTALSHPNAIRPQGPYLMHSLVDALFTAGLEQQAEHLLRTYWGAMLAAGLDTFPEVFHPDHPKLTPYNSHLANSHCHAWSCTPAHFIRTKLGIN